MATIKIEGMRKLIERAEELERKHELNAEEILTDRFFREHTDFDSFAEFRLKSGLQNVDYVDESDLDVFVRNETKFADWRDLLKAAAAFYTVRKLLDD